MDRENEAQEKGYFKVMLKINKKKKNVAGK